LSKPDSAGCVRLPLQARDASREWLAVRHLEQMTLRSSAGIRMKRRLREKSWEEIHADFFILT
jgi:hypothetical protein